ncbi:MAG: polyprenyl synthetase family protein [Bacteroidales bacterium]|nr:polyprenyl synthetase family protein [Bacteroidales bacterium]
MYKQVQKFLGQSWSDFQDLFAGSLRSDIPLLDKANAYMLGHGGKKLRPTFTLLVAQALGGPCNGSVIRCAAASELLHTATLLHDDVADNAPTRRGAPTVMALYSPTTAVLLGDFWLSRAMDLIIDHPDKRVLKIFSKCLGDLARGEMLQLEKARRADATEEDYGRIIYCKTTSLFEAAIVSAACSVGARENEIESCRSYAYHIGQSFQMMDDILDYSPELSIGKPTGHDILEKKITLPLFGLFANAPKSVSREIRHRMLDPDERLSADAIALVKQYDGLGYARERLDREIALAVSALAPLPESESKTYLEKMAALMAVRTV